MKLRSEKSRAVKLLSERRWRISSNSNACDDDIGIRGTGLLLRIIIDTHLTKTVAHSQ